MSDTVISNSILELSHCTLCPRNCGVDRLHGQKGFCGQGASFSLARAALHFWEEPCISGDTGSGAVFFSGCNMQCIFCQNHEIALSNHGREVSSQRLTEIFLELQSQGACNINLVTAAHFIPMLIPALKKAKVLGLSIPVVYNSSGYEKVEALRQLEGLIDIYLPDLKYFDPSLSMALSKAPDYFEVACKAIDEMVRQVGEPVFDSQTGLLKKGVIVRHLCLPEKSKDTKKILRYLHTTYGESIYISIMNQYTPQPAALNMTDMSFLSHPIEDDQYEKILQFALKLGIENAFYQEGETQKNSFIPPFTYEGL